MELPNILRIELDKIAEENKLSSLKEASANLTNKYKNESGKGKRLVTTGLEATTYSLVRMPATYSSVFSVLKYTFENFLDNIETVLDVGAGTGACSWAVSEFIDNQLEITCLEREEAMISVGKKIAKVNPNLNQLSWVKTDFTLGDFNGKYDLVIASYALNELSESDRINVVKKLWQVTNKLLIIIEPGTPVGFEQLKEIRTMLINDGGFVIAPCTHNDDCKLMKDDWCHFTCRVQRSKLHKLLKDANVPYEDEKFSYVAVTKQFTECSKARILRHPLIESGRITLKLCTDNGVLTKIFTKKNGNLFKTARKANSGDSFTE